MHHISWIAVIASAVAAFVLGGLWYGPLFSKPWMREMGVDRNFKQRIARPVLFGLAITLNFLAALVFGLFVGPAPSLLLSLGAGAAVGLAWVGPSMLIAYLFADRTLTLAAIDAGYAIVQFVLFGAIFFVLG
jgi:MFS family permease